MKFRTEHGSDCAIESKRLLIDLDGHVHHRDLNKFIEILQEFQHEFDSICQREFEEKQQKNLSDRAERDWQNDVQRKCE